MVGNTPLLCHIKCVRFGNLNLIDLIGIMKFCLHIQTKLHKWTFSSVPNGALKSSFLSDFMESSAISWWLYRRQNECCWWGEKAGKGKGPPISFSFLHSDLFLETLTSCQTKFAVYFTHPWNCFILQIMPRQNYSMSPIFFLLSFQFTFSKFNGVYLIIS